MKKISTPIAQRLADLRRGPFALVIWFAAGLSALLLLAQHPMPATHVVWIPPLSAEVTAPQNGRIELLSVRHSQVVRRGDVVGRLNDDALTARLATELARVEELRARVSAAEIRAADNLERALQGMELSRAEEMRRYAGDLPRYQRDEANRALDVLALEVRIALDMAEIELLTVQRVRADNLAQGEAGPVADAQDLALLLAKVERGLAANRALLATTQFEHRAASARRETFIAQEPVGAEVLVPRDALAGVRAAVDVQLLKVAEIRIALSNLLLIAPLDGQVHELLLTDGQNVRATDPILRIVAEGADEAVLFLDPANPGLDVVGKTVEVRRAGRGGPAIESTVKSMAPHVQLMPRQLWLSPEMPRYGRPAIVPLGDGHQFVPGEVLGARVLK